MKNAGKEPQKNTWGNLIKNYNTNARGNVEQFSICSNDSIWEDEERRNEYFESKFGHCRDVENYAQTIYFNGFNRFEKNGYDNFEYKKIENDEQMDKSQVELNNDSLQYANDQHYQVCKSKFY